MTDESNSDRAPEQSRDHFRNWLTETPYWAISATVHLVVLLVIGGLVISRQAEPPAEKKVVVKRTFKPKPFEPHRPNHLEDRPNILEELSKVPFAPTKLTLIKPVEPPKGRRENVADKRILNSVNDAFSTSGDSASLIGTERGNPNAAYSVGGTPAGTRAVRRALEWLKRHQHPDGHWSSHKFYMGHNVDPDPYRGEKLGFNGFDIGVTSLALLAFLGDGHTHRESQYKDYRKVVRKAMNWLLAQQVNEPSDPMVDGRFGQAEPEEWIYNHAIATLALAELLYMSGDRFKLGDAVTSAAKFCMRSQNPGYGWKYAYRSGRNDSSVTGWMVLALKAAKDCASARYLSSPSPEDFREHFEDALNWFDRATGRQSGLVGYQGPGDEGSRLQEVYGEPYPYSKRLSCMTAVSVLCRLFAEESKRSEAIKNGIAILMREPPVWTEAIGKRKSKVNFYYWYYGSYALFQFDGPKWKKWNEAMIEALVPSQIVGSDKDGSWDPIGEWGAAGGRVYSTAMGAMTLEVYARFRRQSR